MTVFTIIFLHELRLFWKNFSRILSVFLFFLMTFFVFQMIAANQENQGSSYSITIIWFSLLSALIFSFTEFLKKDFEDGTVEQLLISCENFEIVVLAKMLAGWLVYCLPMVISAFVFLQISEISTEFSGGFVLSLILASLAIGFICSFCGSLSVLAGSASMIALIALPLIVPVLLIAYKIPQNFVVISFVEMWRSNLQLLSAIAVFICFVSVFATAKIVKIAAE